MSDATDGLYYTGMNRARPHRVRRAHAVLGRFEDGTHCVVMRDGRNVICLSPSEAASIADSLIDVAEQADLLDAGAADGSATTTTPGTTVPGSTN